MSKVLLAFAASLVLFACTTVTAIDPGKPATVGDITVDAQLQWANIQLPGRSGTVWSIDGFGLDELRFYTGIAPGQPLMLVAGVAKNDMPAYSTTMLPDDVMELVAGTLTKNGYQQIRTSALSPAPFGTATGFRFDLAFATESGLQMKGVALAAQRNGKLDLLIFTAAAEYYYERYAPAVERLFGSIRTPAARTPTPRT